MVTVYIKVNFDILRKRRSYCLDIRAFRKIQKEAHEYTAHGYLWD